MVSKIKKMQLDKDEQAIEDNFDNLKAYPADEKQEKMKMHKKAATNYLKKDTRITIRVYSSDLERLKILAAGEGLPYQTFITSMLHKISTGRLRDLHG